MIQKSDKELLNVLKKCSYNQLLSLIKQYSKEKIFNIMYECSDERLLDIIQGCDNEDIITETKNIIFNRYQYMPQGVLKSIKVTVKQYEYTDIIQEGYLFISEAINKYDKNRGIFKPFLFNLMKKSYLSLIYQKKRYLRVKDEVAVSEIYEVDNMNNMDMIYTSDNYIGKKEEKSRTYENIEVSEMIARLKKILNPDEYNCIISKFYGLHYKDICKAFGYNEKQVDNKIQNIRKYKAKAL